ncbi:hypothetical protein Pmani_020122 [Petrolisthes manimaculis]|uniref:Uncharacterized protein n=1 Tax=Petrolisthes manimaculis TaxID=1843537 RepID=A0AAE1PGW7_9EUCA|nr:hypothetical protein Pmani_020122 [Petrolisthes manimaculis]
MSSTVQLDITHLTLPPINLTADDVQAKFVTFKGSFQQEVKKIHNTPSGVEWSWDPVVRSPHPDFIHLTPVCSQVKSIIASG